jgi:hypothetical protein
MNTIMRKLCVVVLLAVALFTATTTYGQSNESTTPGQTNVVPITNYMNLALAFQATQDYANAATLYRQAADLGSNCAQGELGYFYIEGNGVTQDFAEAYFWYDLAASGNDGCQTIAAVERDAIAPHLTTSVLLATQERARKWLEAHPSN